MKMMAGDREMNQSLRRFLRNANKVFEIILPDRVYFHVLRSVIPMLDKRRRGSGVKAYIEKGYYVAQCEEFRYYFCSAFNVGRYLYKSDDLKIERKLLDKYTDNGFLPIKDNDVVVDIGANVGEFTNAVAGVASLVISIEPDRRVFNCLVLNTKNKNNIITKEVAVGGEDKDTFFFSSHKHNDSSLYESEGVKFDKVIVKQKKLASILRDENIDWVDFLKVEAEGYEPEILESSAELLKNKVAKVAVDGGPERDGKPTAEWCAKILLDLGFDVVIKDYMVYAKKK